MKPLQFPKQLQSIPVSYQLPSSGAAGKLVNLKYQTKEASHYFKGGKKISKRAIVYLPPNYDEQNRYNVFYLMHGGWSDETTYLGTPEQPSEFKNVLDHAINEGVMTPMIVVCPTYNNLSPNDSSDYGLALRLTAVYYHELINDLMPAVAENFSTFAKNSSKKALAESRDHRAFAGFSMGSVTTWQVFANALDYFRYFMPSSGAIASNGSLPAEFVLRQAKHWDDFFIFAASGTDDFAYPGFDSQIRSMIEDYPDVFRYSDDERFGNLYYLVAPNGTHGRQNALEDFYNGMIQLWKEGK
jgi:S-formylglutathione hydrolase FrmB